MAVPPQPQTPAGGTARPAAPPWRRKRVSAWPAGPPLGKQVSGPPLVCGIQYRTPSTWGFGYEWRLSWLIALYGGWLPSSSWVESLAYVGLSAWTSLSGFYVVLSAYVLVVLVHFAYHVFLVGVKGQTLGKMALGIQVVNADGNTPGFGRALLREVPGKLISRLPLYLGYFWAGWDPHKRAWHDHISGTFVVRKQRQQSGPS